MRPNPDSTSLSATLSGRQRWLGSLILIGAVLAGALLLVAWKRNSERVSAAASGNQPEPAELVTLATAATREYRQATTAVGTVLALQSITLRNEVSGTVRRVAFEPGQVVEKGELLVALDVQVEQAELAALEAQAILAETTSDRMERLREHKAVSQEEADQAHSQRDVARAQMARVRAVIARKTIRAPFRARAGIADVHPGQYLPEGAVITTLQGVADAVHVDFTVSQRVAGALRIGSSVQVIGAEGDAPLEARIIAIDSRVDPTTRNATIRARLDTKRGGAALPSPGASVRVHVPVGQVSDVVAIPVSALRKGPAGDHVWVVAADSAGTTRAHERKIQSGAVLGDTVVVLAGLKPGDRIAAGGSFKLREQVKVIVAEAPTASAIQGGQGHAIDN